MSVAMSQQESMDAAVRYLVTAPLQHRKPAVGTRSQGPRGSRLKNQETLLYFVLCYEFRQSFFRGGETGDFGPKTSESTGTTSGREGRPSCSASIGGFGALRNRYARDGGRKRH